MMTDREKLIYLIGFVKGLIGEKQLYVGLNEEQIKAVNNALKDAAPVHAE